MSRGLHPPQLVSGSQILIAETLCGKRSHQLGEGQAIGAETPSEIRPPQLVLESQGSDAEMPMRDRSQGKGHHRYAEMPRGRRPSQPVYGSRNHNAAMPMEKRSHLFTRGQTSLAEMPRIARLSREGLLVLRRMLQKAHPSPPVLGHPYHAERPQCLRPILTRGQNKVAEMPLSERLATKEIQYGYKI